MHHTNHSDLAGSPAGPSTLQPRHNSTAAEFKPTLNRSMYASSNTSANFAGTRDREHSISGMSTSSFGGTPSPSVTRSGSRRVAKGAAGRSGLPGGPPSSTAKRRRDKHALALRSIRDFLRGSSCYDCLPVSFRLVVLDTKLIVRPALEIMWQAGIVSAPLWQSTSEPLPADAEAALHASQNEAGAIDEQTSPLMSDSSRAVSPDVGGHSISPTSYPGSSLPSTSISAASAQVDSIHARLHTAGGNSVHQGGAKESSLPPPPGRTGFAGMLTVNDIIHLIQYFYKNPKANDASQNIEQFRLGMLRDIEHSLHVPPPPLLSIDPMRPIFDACQLLMKTHARRLPLLDHDEHTGMDVIVSVLTQYRVLKFIAMNCRETAALHRSIRSLGIGTYANSATNTMSRTMTMSSAISSSRRSSNAAHSIHSHSAMSEMSDAPPEGQPSSIIGDATTRVVSPSEDEDEGQSGSRRRSSGAIGVESMYPLATTTLDTTVFDVVHIFSKLGISGVPVVDEEGNAVDMFETVDVIDLVRSNASNSLDITVRDAIARRSKEFQGVMTVSPDDSLATIFALLRTRRVHRMLILEPESRQDDATEASADSAGHTSAGLEHERAVNAAVASDTGAVGDAAGQKELLAQQKQQAREASSNFSGDMLKRKRGKLMGILCLSDIMRYIISSPERTGEKSVRIRGPASSTMASSLDPHDATGFHRPRQGSSESGDGGSGVSGSGLASQEPAASAGKNALQTSSSSSLSDSNTTGTSVQDTTLSSTAARFDPNDVPPTIEESPVTEDAMPLPLSSTTTITAADDEAEPFTVVPEDQTPTQEKPSENLD